jgi:hypothetical protein
VLLSGKAPPPDVLHLAGPSDPCGSLALAELRWAGGDSARAPSVGKPNSTAVAPGAIPLRKRVYTMSYHHADARLTRLGAYSATLISRRGLPTRSVGSASAVVLNAIFERNVSSARSGSSDILWIRFSVSPHPNQIGSQPTRRQATRRGANPVSQGRPLVIPTGYRDPYFRRGTETARTMQR